MSPDKEALQIKYQELHSGFREVVSIYFKACTIALTIFAVGLGYLLKVPLPDLYVRSICIGMILIFCLWYLCSYWAIKTHKSLTNAICDTSKALGLAFEPESYRSIKIIIMAFMVAFAILVFFIGYLLFYPPVVYVAK